jgi:hypothetical protein
MERREEDSNAAKKTKGNRTTNRKIETQKH